MKEAWQKRLEQLTASEEKNRRNIRKYLLEQASKAQDEIFERGANDGSINGTDCGNVGGCNSTGDL